MRKLGLYSNLKKVGLLSSVVLFFLSVTSSREVIADESGTLRPMTFLDIQMIARPGGWTPSPDGKQMLYTVAKVNWEKGETYTDIHLVSIQEGLSSTRQMTFTPEKDEKMPKWSRDAAFFVFLSNRDSSKEDTVDQLYQMRLNGGEARQITSIAGGVGDFSFSLDGEWLAYRGGQSGQQQIYRLPIDGLFVAEPEQLTLTPAGVDHWQWAPDSRSIYFTRSDFFDADETERNKNGFSVDIKNMETPLKNLWQVDFNSKQTERLTNDPTLSVSAFEISRDGKWLTFNGASAKRYERNITAGRLYADPFVLEIETGHIERLTNNYEIAESGVSISPNGRWIVFSAPDDMKKYSMSENRIYVRQVEDRGEPFRKLGSSFDGSLRVGFWSEDGNTLFFNAGVRVTTQLHALNIDSGNVSQITKERAALSVDRDEDSGVVLISYSDPETPPTVFSVTNVDDVADRSKWVQLVEANPQVKNMLLGEEVEVEWRATDGKTVGGVLVRPVGYKVGTRYPLIVAIHGGPASADVLRFNGGYGAQVYAGSGYAVLKPNYRGSRNYGNAHRTDIVGDYFTLGFEDIMSGVDYLIREGIADPDRMGALGWSAGGHWSNWILTHTDRFKAISSGAGTMNWISMYAQSDVQRNRQFYVGNDFMYDNFETYWNQSPLKYIKNAKTPTMIHVVEGDPRVPSPQSVELHMALKKLGVPTELYMYPGRTHGIRQPRNRLVKSVSEMAWMDHYVRGIGNKFEWRQVLETLPNKKGNSSAEGVTTKEVTHNEPN